MPADVRDRGARPRSRSREKRRLSPPRERERDRDFKRPRRSRSRSRDRRDRDRAQAGPKSLDFAARQAARGDGAMEDRPRDGHPRDGRNMRADRDRDLRPSDSTRSDRGPGDSFRHRDREDRGQGRPGEGDPAARANGANSRPIAAGNGAGLGVPMVQGGAELPAAPKKDPLSLDELLKKKQEEQAASAKPKFLTKKEREELALKRREEEAALQRAKQAELAKGHETYLSTARQAGPAENGRRHEDPRQRFDRGPDRRRDRRDREPQDPRERGERELERERQLQAELIKKQYLGGDKQKKKMLKPSEKFKFNFDWEAQDDTSQDANPLYKMTHEASLLFGRGMRAGMDRREQMKAAASAQQDLMAKMRQHTGVAETQEDRDRDKERTRMADKFEDMVKDRHWSEKGRELMTERDWRIFREDFNIAYRGNHVTLPIRNWTESGLPDPLLKAVEKMGYKTPSPIQMAAIPLGLQQRDVIGIAETGSGKTAAFTLPMLVYIMGLPKMTEEVAMDGPYAVVMAPTRELAQQIEEEAVKMASFTDFRMVSVVGGQPIEEQGFKLRKGCEIVIATPGRLGDCLEKAYAVLNQCNYVVLDEADRMIDLGFEPQVMQVLDAMPSSNLKPEDDEAKLEADRKYRTTYMFSATMPPTVERLAKKYLRRPVTITIGSAGRATDNVTQRVMLIKENEKPRMLDSELSHLSDDRKVIVFVNTKRQCDAVQRHLEPQGYNCAVLHGGKDQNQREASLLGFREGRYNVLIATDVAGRGIDVPDVAMVLNYDMPLGVEAYTHRIGRTGRAGKKGVASTFLTLGDQEVFYDLKKLLEDCKAPVPPELARHEASKVKPGSLEAQGRKPQTMYAKK